eukprot:gene7494-9800_t
MHSNYMRRITVFIRRMTAFPRPGTACGEGNNIASQSPVRRSCKGCNTSLQVCQDCPVFPCNNIMMQRYTHGEYSSKADFRRPWIWVLTSAGIYALLNTEQVPITDRLRIRIVPEFIERKLDAEYDEVIVNALTTKALPVDSEEHRLVQDVGNTLSRANGLPPLEYFVIEDDEENAFVSAGGKVIFYTGLLRILPTTDEVAVVLSHELAHFVARHNCERTGWDWIKRFVQTVLGLQHSETAHNLSTMALTLPRSRQIENEADQIGLILLSRACYDITAAPKAWEKLHASKIRHLQQRQQAFDEVSKRREDSRKEDSHKNQQPSSDGTSSIRSQPSPLHHSSNAFLEDSIEPETFSERLWATHPTHNERLNHFRIDGPWMKVARKEQLRFCSCQTAADNILSDTQTKPLPAFHETRPMRWWVRAYLRYTAQAVKRTDPADAVQHVITTS